MENLTSTEGDRGSPLSGRRWILWTSLAVVVLLLLIVLGLYSGLLGARVFPGAKFAVLGPDTLVPGQPAVITWDVSPENVTRYPTEKIELCRGQFFGQQCIVLAAITPNDGHEIVRVPTPLPTGTAYLRLTARATRTGGVLPNRSSARLVTITQAVGGGSGTIINADGPRVSVRQGERIVVALPGASAKKKVEVCWSEGGRSRCRILAVGASGSQVALNIPPHIPRGAAVVRVTERHPDGQLGTVLFQRPVFVKEQPSRVAEDDGGGGGGGGESGSQGSGGGDQPAPPGPLPRAEFIVPESGEVVPANVALDVRLKLTETSRRTLTCQQWFLDGVPLPPNDWEGGQSPDLSAEPCQ